MEITAWDQEHTRNHRLWTQIIVPSTDLTGVVLWQTHLYQQGFSCGDHESLNLTETDLVFSQKYFSLNPNKKKTAQLKEFLKILFKALSAKQCMIQNIYKRK